MGFVAVGMVFLFLFLFKPFFLRWGPAAVRPPTARGQVEKVECCLQHSTALSFSLCLELDASVVHRPLSHMICAGVLHGEICTVGE